MINKNDSNLGRGFGGKGFGARHRSGGGQSSREWVAVSAEGNSLDSLIDLRFGRCNYFMLFHPGSHQVQFIENPGREASGGAGPAAAQLLADHGVRKVVSGDFGPKAADALRAIHMEMVTLQDKGQTLKSLIDKFQ